MAGETPTGAGAGATGAPGSEQEVMEQVIMQIMTFEMMMEKMEEDGEDEE
jgi:hypothetical protein